MSRLKGFYGQLAAAAALACAASAGAAAQSGSQAAPLPLSGRSGQGGAVVVTQSAVPGATTSVNTISPTVQIQGPLAGSTRAGEPFSGDLGLAEAVQRGLQHNLGAVSLNHAARQAESQRTAARSSLLPTIAGDLTTTQQQLNLAAMGLQFDASAFPDFPLPSVVGPFNYYDFRARLSQTVFDLTSLNNYRASRETVRATDLLVDDTREVVVLAVAGAYFQAVAAGARVDSARVQLETADALYRQAVQRRDVGLAAQVDVDRSQIQALTQQQRLSSLENDFAKQKINLARMVGLPPTDRYSLADTVGYSTRTVPGFEEALRTARAERADLQAAAAQVRAAERALSAARAERLPTVSLSADYGVIGQTFSSLEPTFSVVGRVHVPVWEGGRTEGHVAQAATVLMQRRAELEDLSNQIEGDVRKALLDLEMARTQVELAQRNIEVTREVLDLTRQRFEFGVGDNIEVVQAQESVAVAELDYINALFAHNVSGLNLARIVGQVSEQLTDFVQLP